MRKGFDYDLLKSIMESEFDFITHFPLVKSATKSNPKERIVYLNSSNEKLDLQGDIIDRSAIKKSLQFYTELIFFKEKYIILKLV